ncbi:uncharacterized protein PV09_08223 [Verruconis gallopava]|uniref:Rhodopsin domain-containing protein n=1 Tax=Verruconis gallopava TaxID=253628 RepID=A0A0D1YH79_9PEZI|nr:uncharacterized protein PV09_08223 [Verruconis gallopava]KIW00182.1 hypothetical protein PV09_08223 [Verruconis gallopava]
MVREVPPADVQAKWPPRNSVNPVTAGPALNVISILFCVLAYIVVALRIYVRGWLLRSFGVDDWLILICLLPALALAVASFMCTSYGWGIHVWDQKPEWYSPSELLSWIIQLMYICNMFLTKVALLVSYLRFSRPGKFRLSVYAAIVVVTSWFIGSMITTIFECIPVQNFWLQRTYKGCPMNDDARLLACVLINIFTDFVVCLMPLRIVWQVKIATREKVVLYVLLSLGLVASIASIVRTIVMDKAITTFDITWWGYSVWIWTCIECDLAIICASVPCLRPLSKKFFFFLKTSSYGTRSGGSNAAETHRMDDFSKRSRRSVQEIGVRDEKHPEGRVGRLPSVIAESEESLV